MCFKATEELGQSRVHIDMRYNITKSGVITRCVWVKDDYDRDHEPNISVVGHYKTVVKCPPLPVLRRSWAHRQQPVPLSRDATLQYRNTRLLYHRCPCPRPNHPNHDVQRRDLRWLGSGFLGHPYTSASTCGMVRVKSREHIRPALTVQHLQHRLPLRCYTGSTSRQHHRR